MTEAFLHHVWKYRLYAGARLITAVGESVEVIHPGYHNQDAGPDFLDARIRIGKTLWAGHVEMHLKASSWHNHGHDKDAAYDNVVLHVVFENDKPVGGNRGDLPTVELRKHIDAGLLRNYDELVSSMQWISCSHRLHTVPSIIVQAWLDSVLAMRLEKRTRDILALLKVNDNNWEETFYHRLASNFGMRVNASTFMELAQSLPLSNLQKHRSSLLQVESMIFGQSGLLPARPVDDYCRNLQREYRFLKTKFRMAPVEFPSWKFLRMRPASFPTVRMAQLAMVLHKHQGLFSRIVETQNFSALRQLFSGGVSAYWMTHFRFQKESAASDKEIGDDFFHSIVINTVVPFLFAYGKWKNDETTCRRAVQFIESVPAEDNKVTRMWTNHGIRPEHAGQSQALLQLRASFCEQKNCVNCSIGNHLISTLP